MSLKGRSKSADPYSHAALPGAGYRTDRAFVSHYAAEAATKLSSP